MFKKRSSQNSVFDALNFPNMMQEKIRLPKLLSLIRQYDFPKKLGLLEIIFGKHLAVHGVCWVSCYNKIIWKLDLTDPGHRWMVYGKYEGGVGIDYAKQTLERGGVFVDSGSNIGQWSLYLSGIKGVQTLAFEPVDSQRDWLKECVQAQNSWDIQIYKYGLGAKQETVEIQCDGARSTTRMDWYAGKNFKLQEIEIRKVGDILKDRKIDKVTFWKLDVEGAELGALIGARDYLVDQRIENIFFECHPSNYIDVRNYLESFSYSIYDFKGHDIVLKSDVDILKTENLLAVPHN